MGPLYGNPKTWSLFPLGTSSVQNTFNKVFLFLHKYLPQIILYKNVRASWVIAKSHTRVFVGFHFSISSLDLGLFQNATNAGELRRRPTHLGFTTSAPSRMSSCVCGESRGHGWPSFLGLLRPQTLSLGEGAANYHPLAQSPGPRSGVRASK